MTAQTVNRLLQESASNYNFSGTGAAKNSLPKTFRELEIFNEILIDYFTVGIDRGSAI